MRIRSVLVVSILTVSCALGMLEFGWPSSAAAQNQPGAGGDSNADNSLDKVERSVITAGDTAPPDPDPLVAGSEEELPPIERPGPNGAPMPTKTPIAAIAEKDPELEEALSEDAFEGDDAAERSQQMDDAAEAAAPAAGQTKEGTISHDSLMEGLLRQLASPDEEMRIKAGIALRQSAQLGDTENLVKILKRGNNPDKQRFLVDVLGELQDRRAGEALRFELRHGDPSSQRAAVSALGRLHFDWPVPALVRTLRESTDGELKKRAASSLGEIGSTSAEYALRTSMASLEESVGAKNAAFWALEKIRGEVDDERIDTEMPKGRRLQLYYKGTRYFLYHPAYRRGASATKIGLRPWLLVCIHDNDLRVEDVFNICWRTAKKRQMAVLAPYFDNIRYPEYGDFNLWGRERADKRLIEIVEHVGKNASLAVREFYLFGYGTGGDFVQRFAMAYPKRIARAAFESDNYTRPDEELFFPKGIRRSPFAPDLALNMYDFVKTETLLVLRKNSPVLSDGKEFFEGVTHYAEINGVRSRMGVRTVDVKFEIWNEAEKYLFAYE